jgi:hypothetical protein
MNKKMPMIVSHYTRDTGYEKEVANLISSLESLGLDFAIEATDSLGEENGVQAWRRNSNYCSELVQKMLKRYPDRDILRVDADAVFHKTPDLFTSEDFDADIAMHVHDFRWHQQEYLGGTIFFRNTPTVVWLVNYWTLLCMVERPKERNGDLLKEIILSETFNVKFEQLPDTYCKIFDIMRDVKDPVIEHFQASRRFKRRVNIKGAKK